MGQKYYWKKRQQQKKSRTSKREKNPKNRKGQINSIRPNSERGGCGESNKGDWCQRQ